MNFMSACASVYGKMTPENSRKLWKIIQDAGDYLVGQLPDHPNHPKGRNPYAHVAICVKSQFKASYKDIPDEQFDEVIKYIEFLKQNPS
jgi:hypothetical protein